MIGLVWEGEARQMPEEESPRRWTLGQNIAFAVAWCAVFVLMGIVAMRVATPADGRGYSCDEVFGPKPRLNWLPVFPPGRSMTMGGDQETVYDEHGAQRCRLNELGLWERRGLQWLPR